MTRQLTTYWPYNGSVYKGGLANSHVNMEHPESYNRFKIAEMHPTFLEPQLAASTFTPAAQDENLGGKWVRGQQFNVQLSASMREAAEHMRTARKLDKMSWGSTDPSVQMLRAQHSASALNADIDQNVSHVRVIPRIQQIVGAPPNIYYAEQAFTGVPVPQLDARVSEQDAIGMELQKLPTERAAADRTRYTEHRFNLKRNSMSLVWSSEAQMRADIGLMDRDFQNTVVAKNRARELLALIECEKLSTNSNLTIGALAASGTGAIPRAENNPTEDIANITATYLADKSANLTHYIWNPVDFASLLSNYYSMQTALTTADNPGYGLVSIPKNPMLTGVISPLCPRGYVYALDKSACFVGEGPYVTEVERDASIYSDRGYVHDFVQFLIVNRARFGLKIQLTLPAGVTRGTEWTLERARNAANAPAELASETYVDGTFE